MHLFPSMKEVNDKSAPVITISNGNNYNCQNFEIRQREGGQKEGDLWALSHVRYLIKYQ